MVKLFLLFLLCATVWADIGNIVALKGDASLKRSEQLLKAKSGMEILSGDEIITQAKARVQVLLMDDTVLTIGPDSSFEFEAFSFDGSSKSKVFMKANRGFFRSVTGKIGKVAPERFKVHTASATIGIRGTDFSGNIAGNREIIKCYSGGISVEYKGILHDVAAGMMIELTPSHIEVKEMDTFKEQRTENENTMNDIVEAQQNKVEIPMEDIANITQESEAPATPDGINKLIY
ncbi:FecR domain-containing protein [bacterium]|nr:FecR domain-containing protein [bacterium]MBU1993254.1 FecR domain-containing protein [bacterium]